MSDPLILSARAGPTATADNPDGMSPPQYGVMAAVIVLTVVQVVRYERLCLDELAATPDSNLLYLTRRGWLVAIVFVIPFGGAAFLCFGRAR